MRFRLSLPIAVSLGFGLGAPAQAMEPAGQVAATAPAPAPAPPTTAANLLAGADAAVDAGNLELARSLYERIAGEFPGASEAVAARRSLKIIAASARPAPADAATPSTAVPAPGALGGAAAPGDVVVRGEPYSVKTSERLRLTAWEKLDFGTTAFLYGMLAGLYYGLSLDNPTTPQVMAPIALGALSYTAGAVLFLKLADPDRGDLPLALAITSYVPTTTLLVANLAFDHPNQRTASLAAAGAGLLSVPAAVLATREFNLDPGDTQLVRDAGFWGLALAVAGMEGFGGSTQVYSAGGGLTYSSYQSPTGRAVAGAGLAGLYGGLGLGLVGAHFSDVSLERVRVTTWGGYGGAVIGLLIGASMDNGSAQSIYRGVSVGALAGLVVTFLATSSLDGIPPEDLPTPRAAGPRLTPLMLQLAGIDGQPHPAFGLAGLY
jgi:hypothetical protein